MRAGKAGSKQEEGSGGLLTAHFHAPESRGLRHWLAALREGCGPGPPRHDPIPVVLALAWGDLWLVKRQDWSTRRTFSSKKDDSEWRARYLQEDRRKGDPFIPPIPWLKRVSPNKLPLISHQRPITTLFIPRCPSYFSSRQRALTDTSPTKIVMNLASPCGPPIKTNCDLSLNAESVSHRRRTGAVSR